MKPLLYFFLAFALIVLCVFTIAGFRGDHFQKPPFEIFPDMNYQDKVKDQVPSTFFADGSGERAPVPGTVAIEMPGKNDYWATGKWDATHWGDGIPVHNAINGGTPLQVDAVNMARGRERYSISCAVCHGAAGDGKGITSKYGLVGAANYHADMFRKMSDGEIFNTISNGKGQMLGYGYNITIDDRWRIVMYIRALQRSQYASFDDATPEEQSALKAKAKPAAPAAPAPASDAQPAPAKSTSNGPIPQTGLTMDEHSNLVPYVTGDHGQKDIVREFVYPNSFVKPVLTKPTPAKSASNDKSIFKTRSVVATLDVIEGQVHVTGHLISEPTQ